jgi:hypothetical protein
MAFWNLIKLFGTLRVYLLMHITPEKWLYSLPLTFLFISWPVLHNARTISICTSRSS